MSKEKTKRIREKIDKAKKKKLKIEFEYIITDEVLNYIEKAQFQGDEIWTQFVEEDWAKVRIDSKFVKVSNAAKKLKVSKGCQSVLDDIVYQEMQEERIAKNKELLNAMAEDPEFKEYMKLKKKFDKKMQELGM